MWNPNSQARNSLQAGSGYFQSTTKASILLDNTSQSIKGQAITGSLEGHSQDMALQSSQMFKNLMSEDFSRGAGFQSLGPVAKLSQGNPKELADGYKAGSSIMSDTQAPSQGKMTTPRGPRGCTQSMHSMNIIMGAS